MRLIKWPVSVCIKPLLLPTYLNLASIWKEKHKLFLLEIKFGKLEIKLDVKGFKLQASFFVTTPVYNFIFSKNLAFFWREFLSIFIYFLIKCICISKSLYWKIINQKKPRKRNRFSLYYCSCCLCWASVCHWITCICF